MDILIFLIGGFLVFKGLQSVPDTTKKPEIVEVKTPVISKGVYTTIPVSKIYNPTQGSDKAMKSMPTNIGGTGPSNTVKAVFDAALDFSPIGFVKSVVKNVTKIVNSVSKDDDNNDEDIGSFEDISPEDYGPGYF